MPKLTTQQQELFERLSKARRRGANLLEQPYMRGVKSSVIEKYSDEAHFIYELLQNADDVKATKVRFVLSAAGVIFAHNGKIHFSLSDPNTEEEDSQRQQLGHINAITSIGNSNKYEAQIGKFGIGFKAVFQYVDAPEIYDPPFLFKIERFIVPVWLAQDHPARQQGETLFYFPFEERKKPVSQSFQDILATLKNLTHPLLFLRNLTEITWTASGSSQGQYTKSVNPVKLNQVPGNNILVERICLKQAGSHQPPETQNLLVLTRPVSTTPGPSLVRRGVSLAAPGVCTPFLTKEGPGVVSHSSSGTVHLVSIAYLLGPAGQVRHEQELPAYCFFPTTKLTKLRFIVQAPFLLTDSRESLKSGEDWNKQLIDHLAQLTADSLTMVKALHLLTEEFFYVLPVTDYDFPPEHLFRSVYLAVLQQLQATKEYFLPTQGDTFVGKHQAYLADSHSLLKLLSNQQLGILVNQPEAHWIFPSITDNSILWQYVRDNLTANQSTITPSYLIMKISDAFMKQQTDDWLIQFYTYLLEKSRYLWNEKHKKETLRTKPILRLTTDQMVSPYDSLGKLQVYLPTDQESDYPTIKSCLVTDEKALQFLTELGLEKPTDYEEIKYYIIPRYQTTGAIYHAVMRRDFRKLLTYFLDCSWHHKAEYLRQINLLPFCRARHLQENKTCRIAPPAIYFNTPELATYFSDYGNVYLLETEFYTPFYEEFGPETVETFFKELGVAKQPRRIKVATKLTSSQRGEIHQGKCTRDYRNDLTHTYDYDLEGLDEFIAKMTKDKSKLLWNFLLNLITAQLGTELFKGQYQWFYRKANYHHFEAKFLKTLKQSAWLYDDPKTCRKPADLIIAELAKDYETRSYAAKLLLEKLNLPAERLPGFTAEQRNKYTFGEELVKLAASSGQDPTEVFKQFKNFFAQNQKHQSLLTTATSGSDNLGTGGLTKEETTAGSDNLGSLARKRAWLEEQKAQLEQRIVKLTHIATLQARAGKADKYTFAWFNSLLELEYLLNYESNSGALNLPKGRGKEICIHFGQVEKDPTSDRIIILKNPSRYIPNMIEDLTDLSLQLGWKGETKSILVEVVSVKEFTLRARLKSAAEIHGLDLQKVQNATLDISNPTFLLDNLKTAFRRLPLADDYNLQTHLPPAMEFIFGPPGTGKTSYLAKETILPLMQSPKRLKILVLTPTNKAADVLFRKIMEEAARQDTASPTWLLRFGVTGDSEIERAGLLKDKYFDITSLTKYVLVTTFARFLYDGFQVHGESHKLKHNEWDIIIFDEASMIMLASIAYVIYQQPQSQFIIAGDPFQIQPMVIAEHWQEENIYTLVGLNDFQSPQTVPHHFPITHLTTQYRSIPPLGKLFSQFSYAGVLTHHRRLTEKRVLKIRGLGLQALTVITFPVSKFDSIYKLQRLEGGSVYQIYSAILTVELARYLVEKILLGPSSGSWKIGIICPYLAQASLVEKMLSARSPSPDHSQVHLVTGTIHSFQGDECDIILSLLNPPPTISSNIFLNKQNILNVSISRAKDYLILLLPELEEGLEQIKRMTDILRGPEISPHCRWFKAEEVERVMFKQANYIYENSFVTTHQKVNVYSKPDKKYEVRCEDNAIDVQLLF
jgi:hypothetical protein